jgi:predicted membrane chloride channel (bestrophin family)
MTVIYDPDASFWYTLSRVTGTSVAPVVCSAFFWLCVLGHAALLFCDRILPVWLCEAQEVDVLAAAVACDPAQVQPYLPDLDWRAIQALTSLLTFFIVFYGSQSYARFMQYWDYCVALGGLTMDWATLVRTHLPYDIELQWNLTRLPLAAMHLMFYELHSSDTGEVVDETEWTQITDRALLTPEEIERIKQYEGYTAHLPLLWATRAVQEALRAEDVRARVSLEFDHHVMHDFRDLAQNFRKNCGAITNQLKQPVPFPYFHMLQILLFFNLLALSWGLVTLRFHPALTAAMYLALCFVFLGLRVVAVQMASPFGDDPVDFDYEKMLSTTFQNATAILNDTWAPQATRPPAILATSSMRSASHMDGSTAACTKPRRDGETDIWSGASRSEHPGKTHSFNTGSPKPRYAERQLNGQSAFSAVAQRKGLTFADTTEPHACSRLQPRAGMTTPAAGQPLPRASMRHHAGANGVPHATSFPGRKPTAWSFRSDTPPVDVDHWC